ncbi:MAG: DUF4433 domain-containing protein [Steroidobacteraceae bacterium]
MKLDPNRVLIYHITDVANLPDILAAGGLHSDALVAARNPAVIGYAHIKQRRLTELRVDCCDGRFVGEFVPFYFCPRSPMLYTINIGNTGRDPGCQKTIVHLVSTVAAAIGQNRPWAISDGNAGAHHTTFAAVLTALDALDWGAIRAAQWKGRTHAKSAEFLVADRFDWTAVHGIGCQNQKVAQHVQRLLNSHPHRPDVRVEQNWYY